MAEVKITKRGRQALEAGLDRVPLDTYQMLLMEILQRVERADLDSVLAAADRLVEQFGSNENAIAALRAGAMKIGTREG